jgi:hypothetical protein
MLNIKSQSSHDDPIKTADKIGVKRQIIEDNKNLRFVTPATQYEMKYMDSQ